MVNGVVMNFLKIAVVGLVCALGATPALAGKVSYTLHKSANPSADEQEAYELITAAMDSAMYYYNKYTDLSKYINVYYSTGVPTAEASSNGDLRFGKDRNYMYVGTAMHEIAHTMGMGTTSEYQAMFKNGVFQGEKAQALLKELDGADAELHGDSQHFWPYGLNYRSEVHSELDLINHAKIVNAMYQDIFKEAFYKDVRIKSLSAGKCMGITKDNALELMDCAAEATFIKLYSVGENPVAYRIELGERVVDIPNESTSAGVVASTYGWNGGAHQRYYIESVPGNSENGVYLQNSKSRLYLEATGTQVTQNSRKQSDSFVWILQDVKSESDVKDTSDKKNPDDRTGIRSSFMKNSARPDAVKFDLKGRVDHSRNHSDYKVLFFKP